MTHVKVCKTRIQISLFRPHKLTFRQSPKNIFEENGFNVLCIFLILPEESI